MLGDEARIDSSLQWTDHLVSLNVRQYNGYWYSSESTAYYDYICASPFAVLIKQKYRYLSK